MYSSCFSLIPVSRILFPFVTNQHLPYIAFGKELVEKRLYRKQKGLTLSVACLHPLSYVTPVETFHAKRSQKLKRVHKTVIFEEKKKSLEERKKKKNETLEISFLWED